MGRACGCRCYRQVSVRYNVTAGTVSGFPLLCRCLTYLHFTFYRRLVAIWHPIDPGNSTVVVANVLSNTLSVYSLSTVNGALTAATLPQIQTAANPLLVNFGIAAATRRSVRRGFAANPGSNDISGFTSTPGTGVLTPAASPTLAHRQQFCCCDRQGKLLFTGDVASTSIAGFASIKPPARSRR